MTNLKPILVIGATGHVGGAVVNRLVELGVPVRALSRRPAAVDLPGSVSVVPGDLLEPATLRSAVRGVDAVFLVWPFSDGEAAGRIIDVLSDGPRRLVLLSTAAVRDDLEEQDNPIGEAHAPVEQAIRRSGLEWTFLRPFGFATNTLNWASQIRADGVVRGAFGAAAATLIHERDIADVAVAALTEPGHAGRSHLLSGSEPLTQIEQLRLIGAAIGRELRWEEVTRDEARQRLSVWLPARFIDVMIDGLEQSVQSPIPALPTVQEITGRPPRSFRQWAADHAADFR
ncbi:SDR family oxidoreductase [Actinoalloteichus hymeniacidonis]|uniref:NAD(P)-binding domain-containing protein n=1 Tax=Actinoalloteichus hymeniacidonis TaxID=340345 RepID=A0AAC9MYF2_9PSEU|nr:NAD(P)H-binding protein [Actinoalloteichus hymeniacidonis]AOS63195.1 hypothetical protein TL08_11905 [Actinoalloteichus hymeniacidonis]MBB5908768.1 uncharacterized protein YbjT (DUF2867 family) [Actinoalloteichus hymeniacidonis]